MVVKAIAAMLAVMVMVGCAPQWHVATTRIDLEDVEITVDTNKRHIPDEQFMKVEAEATYRCGKNGRVAEYVSNTYQDLTLTNSGVQFFPHYRFVFLFQCVPAL